MRTRRPTRRCAGPRGGHELAAGPAAALPAWVVSRFDELLVRVTRLPGELPATTLCHFDIRDDNLLVRPDGEVMVLDWGMARLGPSWTDLVLLALSAAGRTARPAATAAVGARRGRLDGH